MTRPDVLILANLHDFSTDKVCIELAAAGTPFLRLNRDAMKGVRVQLDPVDGRLDVFAVDNHWTVDETVRSVWFRQPTYLRNPESRVISAADQLERSQWMAFIRALTVFDTRWVNDPSATFRAESKAWQLRIAGRVGFDVPSTLITNDIEAPIADRLGKVIAVKALDTVLLREGEDQLFAFTQILQWADCRSPSFETSPATLQKALTGKLDLRVTVVGRQLWCVAVCSEGGGIEGDWRLRKKDELVYRTFDLPPDVEALCFALMARMELAMGCIDLALADGRYWFIEVNPTGEWGWLDSADRPLARAIAELLSCAA